MILGKHSLQESRDLLARTDYRFKQTQNAFSDLNKKIISDHAAGKEADYDALNSVALDWAALLAVWQVDRKKFADQLLTIALSNPVNIAVSPNAIEAESVWTPLSLYLTPVDDFAKGTLPDIVRRIRTFGVTVDFSKDPPIGETDVDFALFKVLDTVTDKMEEGANAAAKAAGNVASSHVGTIVALGVGALVGTVVLTKIYL